MPTQPAASEMRPLSSADIATLKPSPSAPEQRADGHADAVERELGGVLRAQAELPLHRPRLEARRTSVGTRKALIPFGPSPPVRAKTIAVAAHEPSVMKTFEPVSTHSSPSRSARVASAAASEPQPGSVSA